MAVQTNLIGTEKQVAWAEKIKSEKMAVFSAICDRLFPSDTSKVAEEADRQTKAKFWIENRDVSAIGLLAFFANKAKIKTNQDPESPGFDYTWEMTVKENGEVKSSTLITERVIGANLKCAPEKALPFLWVGVSLNSRVFAIKMSKERPEQDETVFFNLASGCASGWALKDNARFIVTRYESGRLKTEIVEDFEGA